MGSDDEALPRGATLGRVCGRYSNTASLGELVRTFRITEIRLLREFVPRFNVAPSRSAGFEQVFVTAEPDGVRALRAGRWSFVPSNWTAPLGELPTTFNARSEDASRRPFWRDALVHQRCLVPATGWREFVLEGSARQPYHFVPEEDRDTSGLFAFAGLWSTWRSPEGEHVDSFTILTCEPSPAARAIHDRMPLLLPFAEHEAWLGRRAEPRALLERARARSQVRPLSIRRTDRRANDPRFKGPETLLDAPPARTASQLALFGDAETPARRSR